MKKLFIFLSISLGLGVSAQTFEYERSWGTYYGPARSNTSDPITMGGIFLNPVNANEVHVLANYSIINTLPASYYNQYITAGAQPIEMSVSQGVLQGGFDSGGSVLYSSYRNQKTANVPFKDYQIAFDSVGNRIFFKASHLPLPDSGTPGAWFPTDPNPAAQTAHVILYKKDNSGNVMWKTYLPSSTQSVRMVQDEANNIYILGDTEIQQGVTTAGTYYPNYELYSTSPNSFSSNSYIAKLNSAGILQWASYIPAECFDLSYYNGNLYIATWEDTNPAKSQLATAGSWQQSKAGSALIKLDTATGNREWGTYIGNSTQSASPFFYNGLQVNDTGIYLTGYHMDLGTGDNYFATTGAHKPMISGGSDLFLSRFSLDGSRLWSTYYGSDRDEHPFSHNALAIVGNKIFVTGSTRGDGNNISTPGAYKSVKPNNTDVGYNLFFAKFDVNGNQQWCSYYGGPGNSPTIGGQTIGIKADGISSFYLYGSTTSATEMATADAFQSALSPNISTYTQGFLARFDLIGSMATTETGADTDIILHNNPNNGNFTLTGNALEKERCNVKVYDLSGRLIFSNKLPRQKSADINLSGILPEGTYLVELSASSQKKLKVFKMTVK